MDFRVYLDGVQRIVSGVTLETTCKDIVLCLAQATQQFGKFILVERWKNNERLLNPNDYPIKLLSQWGEYASDVIFIMKRCDQPLADPTIKLQTSTNHNLQLQHQLKQHQHHHIQQQLQQSRLNQPNDTNLVATRVNQGNRVENQESLYGSCIPQKHVYYQEEKLINMPSKSSSQSIPPNQSCISQESPVDIESDYGTGQSLMKRPKHPPPYYEAITKSALLRSSPSDPGEASSETSSKHWLPGEAGNLTKCSKEINRCSNCEDQEESQRMVKISRNSGEAKNKQLYRHEETRINDVKLSNLQKDPSNTNNRQIHEMSYPTNYWESKFRSLSNQQRQDILSDHRRLDRLSEIHQETTNNVESDELNEDEDELTRFDLENKTIEVDKNKLKTQLSEIENQIADCRHTIEHLMDQINQLNLQKEEEEMMKRREEAKMEAQLIEMTKEKTNEFERQSEQLRLVDEEIRESDEMLKERIKKIETILNELKEANLQGLSLMPRDELYSKTPSRMKTSQSHVIINPDARNSFHAKQQRPGSTRKMFVPPRELKNAVATSKNPHGVWV